jgi:opacity protein-like surface antigen
MPTGDVSDFVGMGFHVGGNYDYKLDEQFGIGADLNYHMLGQKTFGEIKTKLNALQIGANGKYFFPTKDAKLQPYLKVGLGLYNLSSEVSTTVGSVTISSTTSDSKFGFSGGLGLTIASTSKASYGVEALYHAISTEGSSTNLFTLGVAYNFMMGK